MRIALLAPATSIHTQRWFQSLCERGHPTLLITQHAADSTPCPTLGSVHVLKVGGPAGYVLNAPHVRSVLRKYQPAILNTHYASGYGLTSALVGFRPTLLSVWGSDVYDFPYSSRLAGRVIRWNLKRASRIASTSNVMARQVVALAPGIEAPLVTPFGVDTERFAPTPSGGNHSMSIGTVKALTWKYGIDILVQAFASLLGFPDVAQIDRERRVRLILVGDGEDRPGLEELARRVGVWERVSFIGRVRHDEVPRWLNSLDVYVAASRLDSESFGVAVVEASACGVPVVVSDAGGLPEVVRHEETGIVVPRNDPEALAAALRRLVVDDALRARMGVAGRRFVMEQYEWESCVDTMLDCYREVIDANALRAGDLH